MDWSFDIAAAPRGKMVARTVTTAKGQVVTSQVFDPTRVILATDCGTVTVSRYLPKESRWEGLATGEQPVAWVLFPTHPHAQVEAAA